MSANPNRVAWDATTAEPGAPLQEGNRVLESIARAEALRALLAFSDLHAQIRNRRAASEHGPDRDLFETERFILDEVLQLICDRALAITKADGILVALAEESASDASKPQLICRASSGLLVVERGVRLIGESEFLEDCLESGRVLRCDDCEIDARVEFDLAHAIAARSTVLVPLHGRRQRLGVMQAFSKAPWAFTDNDIRSLDLLAELVLSALKPEDQDRRIGWLSELADQVLQARPAPVVAPDTLAQPAAPISNVPQTASPPAVTFSEPAPVIPQIPVVATAVTIAPEIAAQELSTPPVLARIPEILPVVVPSVVAAAIETSVPLIETQSSSLSIEIAEPAANELAPTDIEADIETDVETSPATLVPVPQPRVSPWIRRLSFPGSTHPGLSVVLGLVTVAALFSLGTWWGIQSHKPENSTILALRTAPSAAAVTAAVSSPSSSAPSDNLMSPPTAESETASLTPVPQSALAALPKVTGIRHWSSSMGSTVVIDMEDQVPYEVHRLMSPERIYFDLHDTVLVRELDGKTMEVGDASLSRVRIAQPVAGVTRIVLDTKDGSNFSVSMESNPYRLVVELRGTAKNPAPSPNAQPRASVAAAEPAKTAGQPKLAKAGKFRIVLDAGHGGWDLGTVGRQGLLEKDLVLDVTQRLGKLLQARLGSDVVYTRDSDIYLPLDQRADIANQMQADLFVSVHANYSSSAEARGVETYYTNLFSAPGSKEVEKHEDGTFTKLTPVSLSAAGLHEKIEESRRLAASVQHWLYAAVAAKSPEIRNRGIKDSSFVVLTGTTMPSILTEISFVSSPADEHNLQSEAYRQQIAEALYQGIARYEQTAPHTKPGPVQTANAKPAPRQPEPQR